MQTTVQLNNRKVLDDAKPGDMIEFQRSKMYSHWGLYVGDGQIIHLTGDDAAELALQVSRTSSSGISGKMFDKAAVCKDDFWKVAGKSEARINNSKDERCSPKAPGDIIQIAEGMLGMKGYNLLYHNCEHFVSLCRYGVKWSEQVEKVEKATVVAALTGLAAMVTALVFALIKKQ